MRPAHRARLASRTTRLRRPTTRTLRRPRSTGSRPSWRPAARLRPTAATRERPARPRWPHRSPRPSAFHRAAPIRARDVRRCHQQGDARPSQKRTADAAQHIERRRRRYISTVESYDVAEAAERSGLTAVELERLCELGVIKPGADGRFETRHLRRAGMVQSLTEAGISLDGLAEAIRNGT